MNSKFDETFRRDEGLFNTKSGWRIRKDPEEIKSFLRATLQEAYEGGYQTGKEDGRDGQILKEVITRDKKVKAKLEKWKKKIVEIITLVWQWGYL